MDRYLDLRLMGDGRGHVSVAGEVGTNLATGPT
jgi:hypothetical protein